MDKKNIDYLPQVEDHVSYMDSFLVATPALVGTIFEKAVIYMVSHSNEGAMGIIVNREIDDVMLSDVAEQLDLKTTYASNDMPAYFGGPVEVGKGFILHTTDFKNEGTISNKSGICLSSSLEMLSAILDNQGPAKKLVALGYAGWEAGQLEQEIQTNSWFTVSATQALLFDTCDSNKWCTISNTIGVDPLMFSAVSGNA